jgi:hypothetical protein
MANFLDIILRLSSIKNFNKHNISETRICCYHQVKPTLLGPINRASPNPWTTEVVKSGDRD